MVQVIDRPPSFAELLGKGLGSGLGQGFSQGVEKSQDFANKIGMQKDKEKQLFEALINHGIDPEDASLYSKLTTGGQTAFAKDVLESRKRGQSNFGSRVTKPVRKLTDVSQPQDRTNESQVDPKEQEEDVEEQLQGIISEQDEGLTPSEKVSRGKERFSTGLKVFQEAGTKLRSASRDKERLGVLDQLNKSKKLPKDIGRLNVDKEGNLRLPFLASTESQRFVKTLNEFSSGAKDTFGSRVTNFDLSQYLKRFPTLLNSEDGRKQLIQQMRIVNDINSVYYKNLKDVYDKAGGVRKIDADIAESLAERKSEKQIESLTKKFETIGKFSSKPAASEFKGKKIRDTETGEILQSNGTDWLPVE